MPRIKQNLVLTFAKDLKAFLRLDAGVGRRMPDDPEELLKHRNQRIQSLQQRLQGRARKLKQESDEKTRPVRESQKEKKRSRASAAPRKRIDGLPDSGEITEQTHALPEPDASITRRQMFCSLISPLKPGRMLDLGTGPGTFSLIAAELGWEVTAVDARTMRVPSPDTKKDPKRAELIKSVKWTEADVREFPIRSGEYDLICIMGLIHHLEIEDHLNLLGRCSTTLTLLDARVAPEIVVTEGPYEGLYYQEPGKTREERDLRPGASWGNELSFRHTEESLLRLVSDCGYGVAMPMRPPHDPNYTFYLCIPLR